MVALAAALLLSARSAAASAPPPLTFQADRLFADPRLGQILLQDNIDLRVGRYRLTGDRLRITLADGSITFDGDAHLALCPCPDPPVTFAALRGRLSATGDLTLSWPRLELFKVPIFALPYLWLRPPDQIGLRSPFVALRGADGLLLGAGVHLPWKSGDEAIRSIDLIAAGYLKGGVELGARLATPAATARIDASLIHGARVAIEARGAFAEASREGVALAFEVDAIRGDRALRGTTDLAAAAAPFDRASIETSIRAFFGPATALFAGGLLARAERGDQGPPPPASIVAGPEASVSLGGALGSLGTWQAGAAGLMLGDAATGDARPVGRAALSASVDARPGPLALHLRAFGRALVAGASEPRTPDLLPLSAALGARLSLELPLIRSFGAAQGEAPLLHWIAPVIELGGLSAVERGDLFRPLFAPVAKALALASGGLSTALGRFAGPSVRLDLRAGALATEAVPTARAEALALARLTADAAFAAGMLELAATSGPPFAQGPADPPAPGFALFANARVGSTRGPALIVDLATASGSDPRAALAIAGPAAAAPSAEIGLFAGSGTTLGVEVAVPFPAALRTSLRADVDLGAGELLAVRGLTEYRHPCGCFSLGLTGAHRVGREGLDLAVLVDLAPALGATLLR